MNEKSIEAAEKALMDLIKRNQSEFSHFRGRIIRANSLLRPDQQMVSSAIRKVNWYKAEISDLEGELDILRDEKKEGQLGEEENSEHDPR